MQATTSKQSPRRAQKRQGLSPQVIKLLGLDYKHKIPSKPILIEEQYNRVPGLFRDHELPTVMETGRVYYLEEVSSTILGDELYALFCRKPNASEIGNG